MDEPAAPDVPVAAETVVCPNCGATIEIARTGVEQLIECPACQTSFSTGALDDNEDIAIPFEEAIDADDELDGLRIRKLVQARRSAIRARTYAVIILICCLVMAAQLIFTAIQEVHSYGWDLWAILYAILAGVMAIGATIASRQAAILHRETAINLHGEAAHAPEFEALSDGSQRVQNLESMQHRPSDDEADPTGR